MFANVRSFFTDLVSFRLVFCMLRGGSFALALQPFGLYLDAVRSCL